MDSAELCLSIRIEKLSTWDDIIVTICYLAFLRKGKKKNDEWLWLLNKVWISLLFAKVVLELCKLRSFLLRLRQSKLRLRQGNFEEMSYFKMEAKESFHIYFHPFNVSSLVSCKMWNISKIPAKSAGAPALRLRCTALAGVSMYFGLRTKFNTL